MILERRLKLRQQFSDFAVLYRSNHQARILEFKLQHFKIPYKLSGGTSFFCALRNPGFDVLSETLNQSR